MLKRFILIQILLIIALFLSLLVAQAASAAPRPVYSITVDGAIHPASADYVVRGIGKAEQDNAQALLIKLDTPGGLMDSMRRIVQAELSSDVPVIVYVSPNGARAGSAGVFITIAANIAAMAPVSNIGSAHPVALSPVGGSGGMDRTMEAKVENDAAEYARSIAERRGRNADWAEQAVRKSVNLTANDALKQNVINYIAEDTRDLLRKIDGSKVQFEDGTVTLHTAKAPVRELPMNARETFLGFLANPNVAAILLMMAIYGIIAELSNPGAIFPGVIGGISLILFLYSFSVLPLNAAGLALVVFAIILFIAEVKVPGTGILTFGGIVSLALGLFLVFNTGSPVFRLSLQVIGLLVLFTSAFFILIIQSGLRALKKPFVTGREGMIGRIVEARTDISPVGKVFTEGTLWTAESDESIKAGEKIKIVDIDGLKLVVRKM
jgi:membrane-bound serine protease (ClpP class)